MTFPRTLLNAEQLRAKKQFGQHFLHGPQTGRKLVAASGIGPLDRVLEIGPGLGALTVPLAQRARQVVAVERDVELVGLLRTEIRSAGLENVHIVAADILAMDLARIAQGMGGDIIVAGNLPYNISSQVLVRLIQERRFVQRAVLMFQKELAERILSPPCKKAYGRLTVMVNYCADVAKIHELKAAAFFPRPKIDSVVLDIRFRDPAPVPAADEGALFRLVRTAFAQRRKMLRNALSGGQDAVEPAAAAEALAAAGISGERRAETLSVSEFVRLSNRLQQLTADAS